MIYVFCIFIKLVLQQLLQGGLYYERQFRMSALLFARYALNTRQKPLKCLGTLRHNLHQAIKITGKIETLEYLVLRVDKRHEMFGVVRLLEADNLSVD